MEEEAPAAYFDAHAQRVRSRRLNSNLLPCSSVGEQAWIVISRTCAATTSCPVFDVDEALSRLADSAGFKIDFGFHIFRFGTVPFSADEDEIGSTLLTSRDSFSDSVSL